MPILQQLPGLLRAAICRLRGRKVFISYRRQDTEEFSLLLYGELKKHFRSVFLDTQEVKVGERWPLRLQKALRQSDVLLAIIGPQWLKRDDGGLRRVDDPNDWVRLEIETALAKGKQTLAVPVNGGVLPQKGDLPATMHGLLDYQASPIGQEKVPDIKRLVKRIRGPELIPENLRGYVAALVTIVVVGVCALLFHKSFFDLIHLDASWGSLLVGAREIYHDQQEAAHSDELRLVELNPTDHELQGKKGAQWRPVVADKLKQILLTKPKMVVLDMVFNDEGTPEQNKPLATVINQFPKAIVVVGRTREKKEVSFLKGVHWGHVCLGQKEYARVDRQILIIQHGAERMMSLAGRAYELWKSPDEADDLAGVRYEQWSAPKKTQETTSNTTSDTEKCFKEGDTLGTALLIKSRPKELDTIRRNPASPDLKDKIVVVGARDGDDLLHVAYKLEPHTRYGVELHVDALRSLLEGTYGRVLDRWQYAMITVGALLGAILNWSKALRRRGARMRLFGVFCGCLAITWYCAQQYLWNNLVIYPQYSVLAMILSSWLVGTTLGRNAT
jgi:hypothetical protein